MNRREFIALHHVALGALNSDGANCYLLPLIWF
jgi:hypothetical protein